MSAQHIYIDFFIHASAAFRALLECDPALQTLICLPFFKECCRDHIRWLEIGRFATVSHFHALRSQIRIVQKYLGDEELRKVCHSAACRLRWV